MLGIALQQVPVLLAQRLLLIHSVALSSVAQDNAVFLHSFVFSTYLFLINCLIFYHIFTWSRFYRFYFLGNFVRSVGWIFTLRGKYNGTYVLNYFLSFLLFVVPHSLMSMFLFVRKLVFQQKFFFHLFINRNLFSFL